MEPDPGQPEGGDGPGAMGRRSLHAAFRGDPTSRAGGTRRAIGLVAAVLALMMIGGALTAILSGRSSGPVTQQALAAGSVKAAGTSNRMLPASVSAMMGLEPSHKKAASFTLTDQHGQKVDLDRVLRHEAVVLSFMDDRSTDIGPLVARELVDAYHDLGPAAARVAFISVNVNAGHSSPIWLRRFIERAGHGIGAVPTFSYLTGTPAALRAVWARYGITVKVAPNGGVFHSEAMYFIARGGTMRYVATPYANMRPNGAGWLPASTITRWGTGIARYARASLRSAPASGTERP